MTRPPAGRATHSTTPTQDPVPASQRAAARGPVQGPALAGAARAMAVAACLFCVIVCSLIVINHLRTRAADPLNSAALARLIEQVQKNPDDAALAEDVRALDLLARKAYFTSRRFAVVGAYLLAGGIAVMLAAIAVVRAAERRLPDVSRLGPAEETEKWRPLARWLVGSVGIACLVAAAVLYAVDARPSYPGDAKAVGAVAETPPPPPTTGEILANWPSFRGPFGQGGASVEQAPVDWDGATGRNILWRARVPKSGFNSPVVWGDRLFLTGADENEREVYCFDAPSGVLLWTHEATDVPGSPQEKVAVSEDAGYAAPSVATDGQSVFAIFANGDLVSVDFAGGRRWARNIGLPDNPYGHASSLVTAGELLFVQFDHRGGGNIYAIDCHSGITVWHTARNVQASWASPVLGSIAGKEAVVLSAEPYVEAYDTKTGTLLLRVECLSGEIGSSPAFGDGLVFAGNQFSVLSAVDPVTEEILWQSYDDLPDASSPLVRDGFLYVASSEGVMTCYEARSGKVEWKQEFNYGFYSSPVYAAGNVYALDVTGVTKIFKAGPTWEPVGAPSLGEEAVCTPAFSENRIYIRGQENLYCIGSGNE